MIEFPPETKRKMKQLVIKSEEENKEFGAYIKPDYLLGDIIEGGPDYVTFPEPEEKIAGIFHTHPRPPSIKKYMEKKERLGVMHVSFEPTSQDMFHAMEQDADFECIGFIREDDPVVKCFAYDKHRPFYKDIRDLALSSKGELEDFLTKTYKKYGKILSEEELEDTPEWDKYEELEYEYSGWREEWLDEHRDNLIKEKWEVENEE